MADDKKDLIEPIDATFDEVASCHIPAGSRAVS